MSKKLKLKKCAVIVAIACTGSMWSNMASAVWATPADVAIASTADQIKTAAEAAMNKAETIGQAAMNKATTMVESAMDRATTEFENLKSRDWSTWLTDKTINFVGQKVDSMTNSLMNNFTENFTKFNQLTPGAALQLAQSIAGAGKSPANGEGDGLSKPPQIEAAVKGLSGTKTVPDMLLGIFSTEQKIRLDEQANLSVYLDAAVGNVPCKPSSDRCTILKYLQEQVDKQVDGIQSEVVNAGAIWLKPKNKMSAPDLFNDFIYNVGIGDDGTNNTSKDPYKISSFLSPAPMVAAGFKPDPNKGALDQKRARVLSEALVGVSDFRDYMSAPELKENPNGRLIQAKIMSRFARLQLARSAIIQVNNPMVSDAMNVEFKACVMRPTKEDTIGAHINQHLVNIQQLLKCNNLSLMHLRRVQMEQSRLIATLLASQLDQLSFSTSAESGNTLNNTPVAK